MVPAMIERERLAADLRRAEWLAGAVHSPRLASGLRHEGGGWPDSDADQRPRGRQSLAIMAVLRAAANRFWALPRARPIP